MHDRFFVVDIETNTVWSDAERERVNGGRKTVVTVKEPAAVWLYLGCLLRSDGAHRFFHDWTEYAAALGELTEEGDIVFVHNLAYELDFLACNGFEYTDIIANAKHKPIAVTDADFKIQYRCSYKYFDMSLAQLGKLVGIEKLEYDYSGVRSRADLTADDYRYNLRDCEIVVAAIKREIGIYGSVKDIPYTKTGVIRRRLSDADNGELRARAKHAFPSEDLYNMLESAFTGGFSYGSPECFGQVVHNVYSSDIKSSYPGVMLGCKFPMRFSPVLEGDAADDMYKRRISDLHFVATFEIGSAKAYDRRLCAMPFYKCKQLPGCSYIKYNGKVNYINNFCITVDSVTWELYNRLYEIEGVRCVKISVATSMRRLPTPLIRTLATLAADKERLSKYKERSIDDGDNYRRVKEQLNGMYGANVQKFRTYDYSINDAGEWLSVLNDYKKPRNLLRVYAWGVWITAYARRRLFDGIMSLRGGVNDFVYCDTDSVKSFSPLNTGPLFDAETRDYLKHLLGRDYKAIEHFGEFQQELDGGAYTDFMHFGAKKYFYKIHGEFAYTVAGMPKPHKIDEPGATMPHELGDVYPGASWLRVKLAKKRLNNKISPGTPLYIKRANGEFEPYAGDVYGGGGIGLYPVDYTLSVTPEDAKYCRDYGYDGRYHLEPLNIPIEEQDRLHYIIKREFGSL